MISLLYEASNKPDKLNDSFKDLNIEKALNKFCSDINSSDFTGEIIGELIRSPELIYKRQKTINDFIRFPDALDALCELNYKLDDIIAEEKFIRRTIRTAQNATQSDPRDSARVGLSDVAACASVILQFLRLYQSLNDRLVSFSFTSPLLNQVQSFFKMVAEGDSFGEFDSFIQSLALIEEKDNELEISVFFDSLKNIKVELSDLNESKTLFKNKREAKKARPIDDKNINKKELLYRLSALSLDDLKNTLLNITFYLSQPFVEIKREILFYKFAVRYISYLEKCGFSYVFPLFTENLKEGYIKKLYSLDLINISTPKGLITPNDVDFSPVTIITGENNSGKTVYLKALAFAQLFAQLGLPLPAESANMPLVSNVFAQFATQEKSLGRFEEEAIAITKILDHMEPGAMVFLNELFQSTAYDEIARPFYDIVNTMVEMGGYVVLVTHNEHLVELGSKEESSLILHLTPDHQIVKN